MMVRFPIHFIALTLVFPSATVLSGSSTASYRYSGFIGGRSAFIPSYACASIHRYFPRISYNRSQPCSISILSVSILTYKCKGLCGAVTPAHDCLQKDSTTLKRTSGTKRIHGGTGPRFSPPGSRAPGRRPKDAPIVALAHYYAVPLVTVDVKSLLNIKEHIYELIDLDIITVDEFLDML